MKKLLSFLTLLVFVTATFAQTSSNCVPSSLLFRAYEKDVKSLALTRMYQIKSPDTSLIEVPQKYQDTIWAGLAAICNLNDAHTDSIFKVYCIHRIYRAQMVNTKVDTSHVWTHPWKNLQTTTGYSALDNFLSKYGFTVTNYIDNHYSEALNNWATITTNQWINIRAFADSLKKFNGVISADGDPGIGYGYGSSSTILYNKDSMQHFTFFLGWGDCPSGCTSGAMVLHC